MHRLKTCAAIHFLAVSPPLDGGGLFLSSGFFHNFGYIESKAALMSPTILKIGPYRFFFNSREEIRPHIHVSCPAGVAKFWLEPIVSLASYYRSISQRVATD